MEKDNYSIKQLVSNFIDANCYIIRNSNTTILIDPCITVKELKKNGVKKIDAVFVTHAHADHILHLEEVVKEFNTTAYFCKQALEKVFDDNKNLSSLFGNPLQIKEVNYKLIKDGDIINIGDFEIKCFYTPGHSDCSMCFLIDDNLFTGDTLFNLGIGRTDFYSGNLQKMRESLKRLAMFNPKYKVFPGHETTSNLEYELNYNTQMKELIKNKL